MSSHLFWISIFCSVATICYSSTSYPEINPGCPKLTCSNHNVNLLYTRFDEANSSMHYVWSSVAPDNTTGAPGFFVVESNPGEDFHFDWTRLNKKNKSGFITLEGQVKNAIGVVITKVFMFNDTHNDGSLSPNQNETDIFEWPDFESNDISKSLDTVHGINGQSATFQLAVPAKELKIDVTVFASNSSGRYDVLPRLMYTPKSIHIEAVINGGVNDSLKNQRVGLEIALVHVDSSFKPDRVNTLDDEYSPGVFSRFTAKFEEDGKSSFMDWKPVGYAKDDRIVAHTIDANLNKNDNTTSEGIPLENTPVHAFFDGLQNFKSSRFNLTFGSTKENFYKDSNFTSFAFVIGLDDTPQEELSFLVEMIILAGFGLPAVFIVIAALYITIKRCRRAGEHRVSILDNPELEG